MRILSWPRAGGKTTASIEWLLESPEDRVILTADQINARVLQERIFDYFRAHPQATPESFLTPRHWEGVNATQKLNIEAVRSCVTAWGDRQKLRGRQVAVFIDDLDNVLSREVGQFIEYVTVNDDTQLTERARRAGR